MVRKQVSVQSNESSIHRDGDSTPNHCERRSESSSPLFPVNEVAHASSQQGFAPSGEHSGGTGGRGACACQFSSYELYLIEKTFKQKAADYLEQARQNKKTDPDNVGFRERLAELGEEAAQIGRKARAMTVATSKSDGLATGSTLTLYGPSDASIHGGTA